MVMQTLTITDTHFCSLKTKRERLRKKKKKKPWKTERVIGIIIHMPQFFVRLFSFNIRLRMNTQWGRFSYLIISKLRLFPRVRFLCCFSCRGWFPSTSRKSSRARLMLSLCWGSEMFKASRGGLACSCLVVNAIGGWSCLLCSWAKELLLWSSRNKTDKYHICFLLFPQFPRAPSTYRAVVLMVPQGDQAVGPHKWT